MIAAALARRQIRTRERPTKYVHSGAYMKRLAPEPAAAQSAGAGKCARGERAFRLGVDLIGTHVHRR